jgi:Zn-dependent protease
VLVEPERTRYDMNFRMLRFPVRVHPFFWLFTALLGSTILEDLGIAYLIIWMAAVFVSILVHELGHGLAFRRFGVDSHIVLYAFGGLAVPWTHVNGRWRRIVVSLAGPLAGFLLCGLVWGSNAIFEWVPPRNRPLIAVYVWLVWINLIWNIFNLLPVFPLDGGQVSQEVCSSIWRRNGQRIALQISFVVACLVALYSVACVIDRGNGALLAWLPPWFPRGTLWAAILFAMLAVQSYQLLQQLARPYYYFEDADDRPPWRR